MKLLVGCPISHREWVLPKWFEHLAYALYRAELHIEDVGVMFLGDMDNDPATYQVAVDHANTREMDFEWVQVEDTRPMDIRDWGLRGRYRRMVELRNILLHRVRARQPEAFLSLDSDMLLHPWAIKGMLEHIEPRTAVGGKAYMDEYHEERSTSNPSWARLGREGTLQRSDSDGTFPVDVIMAIKLMSPEAYGVDYEMHVQGEDTGWSVACRRAGVRLVWDGRYASKHVMNREMLDVIDQRVGF